MMPTSPIGRNKAAQSGFTLVEVLAVLLIFGLMAGAVIMNLPSRPDPLHQRGRLMATHIQLAAQTAMIDHQSIGIRFIEDGYEIVKYYDENWDVINKFEFGLEGKPYLELTQNAAQIDLELAEKSGVPSIRFDTTGLGTPFELSMENGASHITLTGSIDGMVTTEIKP